MNRSIAIILLVVVTATGCSRANKPWEGRPVFPVEGRLVIQGKPAAGVEATFHPMDASQQSRPRGVTDAEGKFRLRTNTDGDGAPAGEYAVTFYWPMRSGPKPRDEPRAPPDQLGRRFLDPKQSPFRATVATQPTVVPLIEIK